MDTNAHTLKYWAFQFWRSAVATCAKGRRVKAQLRGLNKDLSLLYKGVSGGEADGEASEQTVPAQQAHPAAESEGPQGNEDVLCAQKASKTSCGEQDAGQAQSTAAPSPSDGDQVAGPDGGDQIAAAQQQQKSDGGSTQKLKVLIQDLQAALEAAAAENSKLQQQNAGLAAENEQAGVGIDRALSTMKGIAQMKNRLVKGLDHARYNLADNLCLCYHNSNAEAYVVADVADDPRLASQHARLSASAWHPRLALRTPFEVPRVDFGRITVLQFVRDFVAKNRPCILVNLPYAAAGTAAGPASPSSVDDASGGAASAAAHNGARSRAFGAFSSLGALGDALGWDRSVKVNLTPDGLGDAVKSVPVTGDAAEDAAEGVGFLDTAKLDSGEKGPLFKTSLSRGSQGKEAVNLFVKPFETEMPYADFLQLLLVGSGSSSEVGALSILEVAERAAAPGSSKTFEEILAQVRAGSLKSAGSADLSGTNFQLPRTSAGAEKFVPYMSLQDDCMRQEAALRKVYFLGLSGLGFLAVVRRACCLAPTSSQ